MKTVCSRSVCLVVFLVSSIAAAGVPNPHYEPGPTLKMGESAVRIASILLNPQLTTCMAEFQKQSPVVESVTVQRFSPQQATYVIRGDLLLGGDVLTGYVYLTVQESVVAAANGFGTDRLYQCQVNTAAFDRTPVEKPVQE